jgi:hypothetical protein
MRRGLVGRASANGAQLCVLRVTILDWWNRACSCISP